jgi:hypothetical protein
MTKKQPAEVRMGSKCSASTGLRGSSPASALWQSPKGARWRLESRLSGGCRINHHKDWCWYQFWKRASGGLIELKAGGAMERPRVQRCATPKLHNHTPSSKESQMPDQLYPSAAKRTRLRACYANFIGGKSG